MFQEQHTPSHSNKFYDTELLNDQHGEDLQPTMPYLSGRPMTWGQQSLRMEVERFYKRLENLSLIAIPRRYLHVLYNDLVEYCVHPHTPLFQHPFLIPSHRLFGYSVPPRTYFKHFFAFHLCVLHVSSILMRVVRSEE